MKQITGTITCLASLVGIVFLIGSLISESGYNQLNIVLNWSFFMAVLLSSLYYTIASKFWVSNKRPSEK